jgi:hypothetical protein
MADSINYKLWLASAAIAAALVNVVNAEPIDTNRPGFSFTPGVVGKDVWQLETSLGYSRGDNGARSLSLPNAELRYGIGDDVELFISGISWTDAESGGSSTSGFGDMSVGTKIAMGGAGSPTRMALLFLVSVPTGKDGLSSDSWDPALGFVWSTSGKLPLAGTAKVTERDGRLQFDNGLKLPFTLNDRQSVFVEWEANVPESGSSTHWLNSGFQWLLSDEIQVDLGLDLSVSEFGDDYRFAAGFSRRF